ncbi:DNA methyltransferase [Agromyces sp. NPDC055661]
MASDAFIVGEGWISEHYFNTNATKQSFQARVAQRRKEWDALAESGHESPRAAFLAVRPELVRAYADLEDEGDSSAQDAAARISRALVDGLGFGSGLYELDRRGPVASVRQRGLDEPAKLVVLDARHVAEVEDLLQKDAATLAEPFIPADDESIEIVSASRALSRLFAADDGPAFVLVVAGRWLLLTDRERWPEGRWLAINLQLVVERDDQKKGGELDRTIACITAESLLPDAEGTVWWDSVFDDSVKHTVGVSKDLREGVRSSIEIIANEVVRRRAAKGLDPLPAEEAQPLAKQALRYLYRILFLLYAEASPELEVLPIGASEYEEGYSLDRLRELVLVELTVDAADRTHFHHSLGVLFRLVDQGHRPESAAKAADVPEGLTFNSLKADLFLPAATAHIDEVGLGDEAMQRVLAHLLLSKEQRGRDRGFISYSDLGINQLGAVYEGLMSYTGFFATTDLFEVAKDGDASKGSWVVPVDRSSGISPKDFVQAEDPITGEKKAVLHARGSFVYRLAGRERQQSASYYTPEVLTKFVVSQALEELLDQDGNTTKADEILELTVCEPALGSGAFAIEAVRQLAEEYLTRKEKELGEKVDPEDRPRELQRVKASIALHQVYGVDLNATAVELAEISLWLDTMVEGLAAPWFGLHLKRGNSLIGARRAVYSTDQVAKKTWLKDVPRDVPISELAENLREGRLAQGTAGAIHHFLLPSDGWGAAVDAKEAKDLAPEALAKLKAWRKQILLKPSAAQTKKLVNLTYRVETLWQFALRRLTIAEREARREIPLWGQDAPAGRGSSASERIETSTPVTRAEIERKLNDPEGAFQRIRRVMNAWNALWFWPLTDAGAEGAQPPSLDEWIEGLTALFGTHFEGKKTGKTAGGETLGLPTSWDALGDAEELDLSFAGAQTVAELVKNVPWLAAAERIAEQQGFFHWELDFATVFDRGGFDMQVGNPPWVRPDWDETSALAEFDAWWALTAKPSVEQVASQRSVTLALTGAADFYVDSEATAISTRAAVSSIAIYPHLAGLRPDLYRCFMERTWLNSSVDGVVGLIHPETHFTDEMADALRAVCYRRLRRHWQFGNDLLLFEIDNHVSYGIHIYGADGEIGFLQASSLYHPDTVSRSLLHDGSGEEPGLKDESGRWDLSPHRGRITHVTRDTLRSWWGLLENGSNRSWLETRMVYAVNQSTARVLERFSSVRRIRDLGLDFSQGWNETTDFKRGLFAKRWGPVEGWQDVIVQGPHFFVGNPFYKSPNETLRSNKDWTVVDLEALGASATPVTVYKPAAERMRYDAAFTHWAGVPARNSYRVAWRSMASNTGERTLISAVLPPGPTHVSQSVYSARIAAADPREFVASVGVSHSLVSDLMIRSIPKSAVLRGMFASLPAPHLGALRSSLLLRTLRLNAITEAYADLWRQLFDPTFESEHWTGGREYEGRRRLGDVSDSWSRDTPLRRASDRRQALVEIDAIVALSVGLSADELCAVYRSQFAVLRGYDRSVYQFDANGRIVPNSILTLMRQKRDGITEAERTATHPGSGIDYTYELPFVTLDREADMRQAYAHFERILRERS